MKYTSLFFVSLLLLLPLQSNAAAQRIVALSPHSVELLFTIGAGDKIVATSEYADYPEQAKNIPRVGGYHGINLERVLEVNPDLVIVWEGGNHPEDIKQLEKLGLTLYRSEPKNIDQIADELIVMGKLVGKEKEAELAAKNFQQRLAVLRDRYQQRELISFFYQVWATPLKGMSASSWINEIMVGCGGRNVLPEDGVGYPSVSLENILVMMPEAIIQPSQHGTDQWKSLDWTPWQEIPAVANQHIFPINGDLLHRFSVRILDGMEKVCHRLDEVRKSRREKLL